MERKITKKDVVDEIIKFVIEWRTDDIDEDTTLGEIHGTLNMIDWMFEHLRSKFPQLKEFGDEKKQLKKGDTMEDLAEIAMKLLPEDATIEVDENDADHEPPEEEVKNVEFYFCSKDTDGDGRVSSMIKPKLMSKKEFLDRCAEFYENRGTHFNDFEQMHVRMM